MFYHQIFSSKIFCELEEMKNFGRQKPSAKSVSISDGQRRKEQNGKSNKVSSGDGGSSENKQCDKDGQCQVPATGHMNHKLKDCKYNNESSHYCRHHWKKEIEDGKATRINSNKDDKKDIGKKDSKEKGWQGQHD